LVFWKVYAMMHGQKNIKKTWQLVHNKNWFKTESVVSLGRETGLTKESNINKNSRIRAWNGFQTSDISFGDPADDTSGRLRGHTIPNGDAKKWRCKSGLLDC